MEAALVVARLVLAAVFAVAGAAKLADLAGSRAAVAGFGVPDRLAVPLGTLLPFAELAIAGLLLPAATARAGGVAALALLALFGVGIASSMARGEAPDCHCSASSIPSRLARGRWRARSCSPASPASSRSREPTPGRGTVVRRSVRSRPASAPANVTKPARPASTTVRASVRGPAGSEWSWPKQWQSGASTARHARRDADAEEREQGERGHSAGPRGRRGEEEPRDRQLGERQKRAERHRKAVGNAEPGDGGPPTRPGRRASPPPQRRRPRRARGGRLRARLPRRQYPCDPAARRRRLDGVRSVPTNPVWHAALQTSLTQM